MYLTAENSHSAKEEEAAEKRRRRRSKKTLFTFDKAKKPALGRITRIFRQWKEDPDQTNHIDEFKTNWSPESWLWCSAQLFAEDVESYRRKAKEEEEESIKEEEVAQKNFI